MMKTTLDTTTLDFWLLWLMVLGAVALYMLPTIIAQGRKHPNARAILAINLMLGWTLLGWIGALVWAATGLPATGDAAAPAEERAPCPYCAEQIITAARVCRFCGRELVADWAPLVLRRKAGLRLVG